MTQSQFFSSGFQLAPFVTSSGLLRKAWDVNAGIVPNVEERLSWKVCKEPDKDLTIVAFKVTQDSSPNLQPEFVSSSDLREKNFRHFEFLSTEKKPPFSVNNAAVSLFYENHQRLDQLKSEHCPWYNDILSSKSSSLSIRNEPDRVKSSPKLIVTGHALGGPIASLFTLSLLDSIGSGKKRPLCITFGSPLIGDKRLQEAISRSSTWNSCFLHFVSVKDPLPRQFITKHTAPAAVLSPQTSAYMPFGTFLLCSDQYSTCFENPDSILALLKDSIHDQNQVFQSVDYGNMVESLYRKAICKDFTAQAEDMTDSTSMHASISLQLWAIGLTPHMQQQQQQNIDIKTLLTNLEELEYELIIQNGKKFDPSRKLNVVKIDMALLEWYKKDSKNRNIGYYDSYKKMRLTSDQDVVKFIRNLINYWEKMVEEAEMKPQKEGAAFRTRWLFGGTNYRRMVEPLVIAQYYRDGGKDYVTKARPKHFKQLEEWLKEETKATSGSNNTSRNNVESILTMDSCFWAYVEEALLSCKQLEDVQSSLMEKEEATRKLFEFEKYVYGLLTNYAVSPEIFLAESSYMTWWNEYKAIKGTSYSSALARFMSNAYYYNVQYVGGTYNFD
ncbi:Fungal lipase-like domain [Sesbania bispinosa]|nr:Fungal lipase-like domain [Sesbania bispinosa]